MESSFTTPDGLLFTSLAEVYHEMLSVYNEIIANKGVCSVIAKEIRMPQPNGKDVDNQYKVLLVLFIDLVKCYQNMGHKIGFNKPDCYLLSMVLNIKVQHELTSLAEFIVYRASVYNLYSGILRSFEGWSRKDGPELLFTRFAKEADKEICRKYVNLIIIASRYIKTAKPTNIRMEYKWISELKAIRFE